MRRILAVISLLCAAGCGPGADSIFQEANRLQLGGDYAQAIIAYRKALELKPDFAPALNNLGMAYERSGDRKLAVEKYEQAIKADPGYAPAYNNLGAATADAGGYARAVTLLDKALQLQPGYAVAHINRGLAYYGQGMLAEALADFSRAVELNDKSAFAYYNRGLAELAMKDYPAAARDFSKAAEIAEKFFLASIGEGKALMETGDYSRAAAAFSKAVAADPQSYAGYYYRAQCRQLSGLKEDALSDATKAVDLAQNYAPAYGLKGDMLADSDPREAAKYYFVAKKLDPEKTAFYDAKIDILRKKVKAQR